jgi:hypothetical protein
LEQAESEISESMEKSIAFARDRVDGEAGQDSWYDHQMQRVRGSRSRAKGLQLGRRPGLKKVEEVLKLQKGVCEITGQPIFCSRGGNYSPHCAAIVLNGQDRTFRLAGSFAARGQGATPNSVYKQFFEYWGVQGYTYLRHISVGPDGTVKDVLQAKVRAVLGVDENGELVSQNKKPEKPKPQAPPQPPLPFGGVHSSWGSLGAPLAQLAVNSLDPRYRRDGLSLLKPSPSLAGTTNGPQAGSSKAPVLVEKQRIERLALSFTGECQYVHHLVGLLVPV